MAQPNFKASTQDHLDIDDIVDDTLILKSGGAAVIIQTTAVNFGLLSEPEQDSIIFAYAGLLNSLSFPMQIVIRSKRMDVSQYLESLLKWEQKTTNDKMRIQIRQYREFISTVIRENNVLDKRFYVVVPMYPGEVGIAGGNPFSTLGGRQTKSSYSREYILERAKNILIPKKDHMIRQLTRVGLKATQLTTQQIIELFYDIYNPTSTGSQKLVARTEDYIAPIVTSTINHPLANTAPNPPTAPNSTKMAPEMSPAEVLQEVYGKTPIQQIASNPLIPNPNLPNTSFTQIIQNAQSPFPAPAKLETPSVSTPPPQTQGWQPPAPPTPTAQPNPQSTDEVMQKLQQAINQTRNNPSARGNLPQGTQARPTVGANFNK